MRVLHLSKQIRMVIERFFSGNQTAFSKATGIPVSSLHRQLANESDELLFKQIPKILKTLPTVREEWIYTGEGEMLTLERPQELYSAKNAKGNLIGDTLWEIFGLLNLTTDDVISTCHFQADFFEQVMQSSRYPSWQELQALHCVYGININFLFFERGPITIARTDMERVERAIGLKIGMHKPQIMNAMNAEKTKFNTWFEEYEQALSDRIAYFKKHGPYVDDYDKSDIPLVPYLRMEWIDSLEESYGLNPGFVAGEYLNSNLPRNSVRDLQNRIRELEDTLAFYREKTGDLPTRADVKNPAPGSNNAAPLPRKGTE